MLQPISLTGSTRCAVPRRSSALLHSFDWLHLKPFRPLSSYLWHQQRISTQLLTGSFAFFQTTLCELQRWLCSRCELKAMFKGTPVISSPFLKLHFLLVVERSLNAPSRSLMDAKSHIDAVVVPLRQVCWNAPVCNLKLSLAEGCVCVSQCETTQPFKTITSRKRQVHLTSPCHGHGGNTGDRHNRRNNHKQRICGFSSPSSHSSAGKRSSRTVHRHEGRARGRGKNTKTPLITINLEQPSSPSAVRNRWGQYWAASFLSRAAFASV